MTLAYSEPGIDIYHADARALPLADASVQMCVTSPPYWGLRDYGTGNQQIGLEESPSEYVASLVTVFREVRRVLRNDGVLWLNLGDTFNAYNGNRGTKSRFAGDREKMEPAFPSGCGLMAKDLKPKDLVGIPWRVAFALQADGWYLRSDIIWHKPNPMPESVTDRPTKAHEYLFLLTKADRYFYNADAIAEKAAGKSGSYFGSRNQVGTKRKDQDSTCATTWEDKNKRSVWTINVNSYPGAHFATFPPDLIKPCILAGSRPGDTVLDNFNGSGTTAEVARSLGRRYVGVELKADYIELTKKRLAQQVLFSAESA